MEAREAGRGERVKIQGVNDKKWEAERMLGIRGEDDKQWRGSTRRCGGR